MTGIIQTCEHIKQGAPVALTTRIPANQPGRDGRAFAEPITVQLCAGCVAAGTGGATQIGKAGSFSVGHSDYFGSKVEQ